MEWYTDNLGINWTDNSLAFDMRVFDIRGVTKETRLRLPRKSVASNRQAGYVNYLRNISPLFYYNIMPLSVLVFI